MGLKDKIKSIADAIRSKTGKTTKLTLDQMANEIKKSWALVYINGSRVTKTTKLVSGEGFWSTRNIKLPRESSVWKCTSHNGKIYAFALSFSYVFDGTAWTQITSSPYSNVFQTFVYNDQVHTTGGYDENAREHYKYNGSAWVKASTLPDSVNGPIVFMKDGLHILWSGGSSMRAHYVFDGNSAWTKLSDYLPLPSFTFGTPFVFNNKLYIAAYLNEYQNPVKWIYVLENGSWNKLSFNQPRDCTSLAVVALGNKAHFLYRDDSQRLAMHYTFNGSVFEIKPPCITDSTNTDMCVVVIDGKINTFGTGGVRTEWCVYADDLVIK